MIKLLIISMRPRQWTKNLLLFAGVIFSRNLLNFPFLLTVSAAFLLFCLLSSCLYIVNDVCDRREDRNHPRKGRRPIASGKLPVGAALTFSITGICLALILSFFLGEGFGWIVLSYLLLLLAYSLLLKRIVIVDILSVAVGFVLRAVAGGVVIGVEISSWLIICTILLALFLVLSKRRHELLLLEEGAESYRGILSEYSAPLLDQMVSLTTASTVIAYCLYTLNERTVREVSPNLKFTIPFVLYGIFRYLYLVHRKEEGGSPEGTLLRDKPLLIDLLLWMAGVVVILYM